ncbi:MAG TPA: hypothetical protein VJ654_00710 [Noviherbaspirillum sp.]|nr:hypothetical protein [Noviherbaspirillum sp.]
MIRAKVTVRSADARYTFESIGFSAAAIDAAARDLFDEPVGVSVMVLA